MDYLDMAMGALHALPSETVQYMEREARLLPVRITHDNKHYALLGATGSNAVLLLAEVISPSIIDAAHYSQVQLEDGKSLTVNDCVMLCQKVLGLKVNEIAKLVGVSRATLDLHRKGSNVKDMGEYQKLYDFVKRIESDFGDSIKTGVRNILIQRKTLLQHLILHKSNLMDTYLHVEEAASKLRNISTLPTEFDESKARLRLSGIGRLA